jgi:hypothetical protein
MVIRPMASVFSGETGRPTNILGEKGRPPPSLSKTGDVVDISGGNIASGRLYSFRQLFKIIGAVELTAPEQAPRQSEIQAAAL